MQSSLITQPFHYHIVKDVYEKEELDLIWEELDSFQDKNLFLPPNKTGAAVGDGEVLKKNSGLWTDEIYDTIEESPILRLSKKLFSEQIINHPSSWFFRNVRWNQDSTLISYYDHGDYYKVHNDTCYVTICTWLFREPKKFSGGNFYFPEYGIKIPAINNAAIVFPSNINHSVDKLILNEGDRNKGLGRYCLSHFLSVGLF